MAKKRKTMTLEPEPEPERTGPIEKFSFNTDGSNYGSSSGSHQGQTASGIGNGGEILGYTLPLDQTLKKLKHETPKVREAAILIFDFDGDEERLLAVANDTGGRWEGDRYDRHWGELGINVWLKLQDRGRPIKLGRNSLTVPDGMTMHYEFLGEKVRNIEEYRDLKQRLEEEGRL